MDLIQQLEQLRRAVQFYSANLDDEKALEVATIYPKYEVGKKYVIDDLFTYELNAVGDPQLYRVIQDHTSQENWIPKNTPSLYTPIGLDDSGYPLWSQPTGSHDAYNTGDVVNYNGTLYESLIDGNTYSPEAYPDGWRVYVEE